MTRHQHHGKVKRTAADPGIAEDADFDYRFRRDRLRRWLNGIRNGMDPIALALFRLGLTDELRFHGRPILQSANQATYRLIEDIWMRGEYDMEGFIPQPGWRVVEIGGNVGIYALLCAARGSCVETYEPGHEAFARLVNNTRGWPITCHHAAVVGVPRKTVTLYLHPLRDTRNTLLGEIGGVSNAANSNGGAAGIRHGSVEVPAVPIARVLDSPCDLLKVACEGAEYEIFLNASDGLRNAERMVIELHPELRTADGGAPELIEKLEASGFAVQTTEPFPGTSRRFLTARRLKEALPC